MDQKISSQRTTEVIAQIWGKLVPLALGLSIYELNKPVTVMGRIPTCDIILNDKRLSSKHCQIEKKGDKIILTDLSTNGTYIKDQRLGKGIQIQIHHNTQIWLLPASRVKPTQALGFRLEIMSEIRKKQEEQEEIRNSMIKSRLMAQKEEQQAQKQLQKAKMQEQKVKMEQQKAKQDVFAQSIKDQITCCFCFEIMHVPVNVQPCNHRFCGACLTDLVNSKKGQCIKCRKQITTAVRDASFNSIIDDYLKNHPDEKRDPKDIEVMNKKNIFTFDPIDINQKINGKSIKPPKKKVESSVVGSRVRPLIRGVSPSSDEQLRCRQCMSSRIGFHCGPSQKHVRCFTCGKLIADRADRRLHQYCVLCNQFFCNLYFPPCATSGIKLQTLQNRRGELKIDPQLLRGNKYEFEYLRNYLISKKMTSKEVFDFVMQKIGKGEFSYVVDRKINKIPPLASREIKMQQNDAVCDLCWKDLWFQMVFFYRRQISSQLPTGVKDRPDCYWGINCQTMDHRDEHAKKYNHMIYQSRF